MKIRKMKKYLHKILGISPTGRKMTTELTVEYEETYPSDQIFIGIEYDYDKKLYKAGCSIYHAGEDNNAENVEGHTDEIDYENKNLKELIKELEDEFDKDLIDLFYNDYLYCLKERGH